MLVCALFFRAAAWRSFSKQGLGVREDVGVLRPWGDLRPAAACVCQSFCCFRRAGFRGGFFWGLQRVVPLPPW